MDQLPEDLLADLDVTGVQSLSGGDTAAAYRLNTPDGPLFAKTMLDAPAGVLELEAAGLEALRSAAPPELSVPRVIRVTGQGLVLEWIDESYGAGGSATEAECGSGLAQIHRAEAPHVGGLDPELPQRIGSFPVDLSPTDNWADFLLHRRIEPLLRTAVESGKLDADAQDLLDELAPRAAELAGPVEPPSLLHGDLWAGNRVVDSSGRNWLIDPSSFYGHREYDLAMMLLFGGFGEACFNAYDDVYPLADGWRERVPGTSCRRCWCTRFVSAVATEIRS
ncbi:fructosamine kinase family protein [Kocuria atrinae]|uniref:fructosamine kinase family protein n=1 Tax=Kocuria atrinae TaxID=592377 RepID=UPI0002FE78F7|nr:fructosamine kinase family protein [Kocuria atrinae]